MEWQCTDKGVFGGVLLWDGEVVVDEFGLRDREQERLLIHGIPHNGVQVSKVVVHVDVLVGIATQ